MKGESLQLGESRQELFRAYLFALLPPLCLVVPLGVFRSGTAEFADQTFEVLAPAAAALQTGLATGFPPNAEDVECAPNMIRSVEAMRS